MKRTLGDKTMSELEILQDIYSDIYKDVYGVRPRHMTAEEWSSLEWVKAELDFCKKLKIRLTTADKGCMMLIYQGSSAITV